MKESSIALYTSDWHNIKTIEEKTMFSYLLMNSQRDLSFKIFGTVELSMETFVKVNQTCNIF